MVFCEFFALDFCGRSFIKGNKANNNITKTRQARTCVDRPNAFGWSTALSKICCKKPCKYIKYQVYQRLQRPSQMTEIIANTCKDFVKYETLATACARYTTVQDTTGVRRFGFPSNPSSFFFKYIYIYILPRFWVKKYCNYLARSVAPESSK